jgi:hypothetical protein
MVLFAFARAIWDDVSNLSSSRPRLREWVSEPLPKVKSIGVAGEFGYTERLLREMNCNTIRDRNAIED